MNAEIITIGDEILIGQIIDTNSAWLGSQLGALGIRVVHRAAIADQTSAILTAIHDAHQRADLIILTGGLGPTKDDLTKDALCRYFDSDLVLNEDVLKWLTEIFTSRKLPMIESNRMQAMLPSACEVLFNRSGTAPGMWFDRKGKIVVSLPGVPFEMKVIFEEEVIPRLKRKFELPAIIHRTIQTCSIGESFLAEKIRDWENALPSHIHLAYLPSVGAVRLRLSGYANNRAILEGEINSLVEKLYDLVAEHIFGEAEDTLQLVTGVLLKGKTQTVSTAESCTGGYVSHLITSVPGSSAYYKGSVIAYANEVKVAELGVKQETLTQVGAVSEECVREMSEGIRSRLGTDYSIATSGIAGPDGGTPEKPVGTVWISVAGPKSTIAKKFQLGDNRERTIQRTALLGLDMLRKMILAESQQ